MRPNTQQHAIEGNLDAEVIKMGFDADSVDHLANVFVNMYKKPDVAALRETACNALDATIAAGVSKPIEVTLPSELSPVLQIRDWGIGLALDDIRRIYSQFGASTKRGGNDQTGMLGIGAKSPLAYTDQFTVISVKDKRKVTVVVSRAEGGGNEMKLIKGADGASDEASDEDDGTMVSIPCERDNDFEAHARDLFRFWESGTVLLNGKTPDRFDSLLTLEEEPLGMWIVENTYHHEWHRRRGRSRYSTDDEDEGYSFPKDVVVMGGVPYPTDLGIVKGQHKVVARVPIGSVDPTPAREELMLTKRTEAGLKEVRVRAEKAGKAYLKTKVEGAKSRGEALKAAIEARNALQLPKITAKYNGQDLPLELEYPENARSKADGFEKPRMLRLPKTTYRLSDKSATSVIRVDELEEGCVIVTDYTNGDLSAEQRRKIDKAIDEGGHEAGTIWLTTEPEPPQKEWLEDYACLKWEDVRSIVVKQTDGAGAGGGYRRSGAVAGTYPSRIKKKGEKHPTYDDKYEAQKLVDAKVPVVYSTAGKYARPDETTLDRAHPGGWIFVAISEPRLKKFLRTVPKALLAQDVYESYAKNLVAKLDKYQRQAVKTNYYGTMREEGWIAASLSPDKIDDPVLADFVRVAKARSGADVQYLVNTRRAAVDNIKAGFPKGKVPTWNAVKDAYPLLDDLTTSANAQGVYFYVNAAYAARQKGSK